MGPITLENVRASSDITVNLRLKDGGMYVAWTSLTDIKAYIYSDAQRAIAGRCDVSIDGDDSTLLICNYSANKPQYPGVNSIVIRANYDGRVKTYDRRAFNIVKRTSSVSGDVALDDPVVDLEIEVVDVSSSLLDMAIALAFKAVEEWDQVTVTERGPEGKSAYRVAVDNGFVGTEDEWLESLVGPEGPRGRQGEPGNPGTPGTPGVTSAVVTVDNTTGSPSATASVSEGVLSIAFSGIKGETGPQGEQGIQGVQGPQGIQGIQGEPGPQGATGATGATGAQGPQGETGATPDFSIGTVQTGAAGSAAAASITGTAAAPVLNLTIPKGDQGNTGSSVDYPFTIVNNLDTDDPTQALSAAMGKELNAMINGGATTVALDLTGYAEIGNVIGSTGNWFYRDAAAPRNSIVIPLSGIHKIKVVTTGNGYIAFLKSLENSQTTVPAGAPADYATGYTDRIHVDTTTVEYSTLPADANYLYIQTRFVDGEDIRSRYTVTTEVGSSGCVFRDEVRDTLASTELYAPLSANQGRVLKNLIDTKNGLFAGKKLAVIGDSISTILNGNTPYWTIKSVDVGNTIQSYVTWEDVYGNYRYPDTSHPTGKTIGGVTLTLEMVDGELHSFTPVLADVGKEIGVPHHYSNNDGSFQVWSQRVCDALGMTLLANASWSGSAITSMEVEGRGIDFTASHAWHPCTIGRCRVRDDEGNFVNPDVIIIYRGTNDFSYGNNGNYPTLQITDVNLMSGFSATTDKVGDSTYDFRTGYYLTVKALREAYPNALIYICTLNVFKRVVYDKWPTRNNAFTLPDFNKVIREIADVTGCGLIELDKDGITFQNCYPTYISDSSTVPTHPNGNGHRVMAEKAFADLTYVLNP